MEAGAARMKPGGDPASRAKSAELEVAEAEYRHHRDRLALYRARVHSSKPSSLGRLRELERRAATAQDRLRHLRA